MPLKINRNYILMQIGNYFETEQFKFSLNTSIDDDKISPDLINNLADDFCIRNNLNKGVLIHAPSCSDICNMIKNSQSLDWLLHLTKKRYRDHFQHQFYVAVLGWILLNSRIDVNGPTLKNYLAKNFGFNEIGLEKSWWIASLLHDHAYPLSHLFSTMPAIGDTNKSFPQLYQAYNLYDDKLLEIFNFRSEAKEKLQKYLFCFFNGHELSNLLKKEENLNDHGIWGAVNIFARMKTAGWPFFNHCFDCIDRQNKGCKSNLKGNGVKCIYYENDVNQEGIQCLKQAIRGIALHNCQDFGPVYLEKDPIGFLLVLSDEMQEWDRHTIVGATVKAESDCIEIEGIGNKKNTLTLNENLIIRYCFDAENLVENDWDYKKFFKSKKAAFSRLKVPKDFPLKTIDFQINVPYSINF